MNTNPFATHSPDELISSNESELVFELNTTDDNVKTDILMKFLKEM